MASTQQQVPNSTFAMRPRADAASNARVKMTPKLFIVYLAWVLVVMEPDWFIGGPIVRLPTLILPILILIVLSEQKWARLSVPFGIFILMHIFASAFAENAGYSRLPTKFLIHMFALWGATSAVINTAPKALILIKIYVLAFFWYGIQGLPAGLVSWHPLLANEDGYGPLMGIAFGFTYYFALASTSKSWKFFAYSICFIALIGIVAANARGAVLSAALAILVVWWRSPRKIVALVAGVVGLVVILIAAQVIFPDGKFFDEVASISDGTEDSTGEQRVILWAMSVPIFLSSPVVGVGAANFGVIASEVVPFDPARPQYSRPEHLYAITPHNIFVQVFAEEGLVGLGCAAALLIAFMRQVWLLRSPLVARAWRIAYGPGWDPVNLSKAFEIGMICFLANGFFYNQLYIHWLWTLLALTSCFAHLVPPAMQVAKQASIDAAGDPGIAPGQGIPGQSASPGPHRPSAPGPRSSPGSLAGGLLGSDPGRRQG